MGESGNVVKFETADMSIDRTQRELVACENQVAANCEARLASGGLDHRTRIENEATLALARGDFEASDRLFKQLERMNKAGMSLVGSAKEN